MGCYTYKDLLSVLPSERTKDWDGDAGYDSELYEIAADYIVELQKERDEARREATDYRNADAEAHGVEPTPLPWENYKIQPANK